MFTKEIVVFPIISQEKPWITLVTREVWSGEGIYLPEPRLDPQTVRTDRQLTLSQSIVESEYKLPIASWEAEIHYICLISFLWSIYHYLLYHCCDYQ